MKKIFISYGNKYYKDSLERIGKEADNLKIFDKILLYNESSLLHPFDIYAKEYKKGGGYWLWKPFILYETLQKAQEGDVIVYADAGCSLMAHKDWQRYFNILKDKDALFFFGTGKTEDGVKKRSLTI